MIRLFDTQLKGYADVLGTLKPKYKVDHIIRYDRHMTGQDRTYTRRQLRKMFVKHDLRPNEKYCNVMFIFKSEIGNRYKQIGGK